MSYITEQLLTEELQRIYAEKFPDMDASMVYVHDRDNDRPRHPFTAIIGANEIKFTVPEDRLHSSPLRWVTRDYLAPVLAKIVQITGDD